MIFGNFNKELNLSSDVEKIIQETAPVFAIRQGRELVTTIHVFLAIIAWSKKDLQYSKLKQYIYNKINKILFDKYKITNKILFENFEGLYPNTNQKVREEEIEPDDEIIDLLSQLSKFGIENKTTCDVEELISVLFNNKRYLLYNYFVRISDSHPDLIVDELYADFCNEFQLKALGVKSLDEISELKCWNKIAKYRNTQVVGMQKEIDAMITSLMCKQRKSFILVGKAGVGKTVLIEELARRINQGLVPDELKDKIIYEMDMNSFKGKQGLVGYTQAKLGKIIEVLKDNPNVILFIDEIHLIYSEQDYADMGNCLKPALGAGEITLIGATTNEEYHKSIEKDKALARRLRKILVHEATKEETFIILKQLVGNFELYHNVKIDDDILKAIIRYSTSYAMTRANPDKSISLLELACSAAKTLFKAKDVTLEHLLKALELEYDVTVTENRFMSTKKALYNTILGQESALTKISMHLLGIDYGMTDDRRPLGIYLLAGPTGTGKTESAKIIAKKFFGTEEALIKLDMGEYRMEHDVSKITGAGAGFVGYDDETNLIGKLKRKPAAVVLFDEIEKAHPAVQAVLQNACDEGYLTDSKGNEISLKNCIILFTTNLGFSMESMNRMSPFKSGTSKEDVLSAVRNYFEQSFLARIQDVIVYDNLTKDVYDTLIERYRKEFNTSLHYNHKELPEIKFEENDIKFIIENAHVEIQGARRLKDTVQTKLIEKLNDIVGGTE